MGVMPVTGSATVRGLAGVATLAGVGRLALRYSNAAAAVDRSWREAVAPRLHDIGEVDSVSVLPLVERHVLEPGLLGEPGVSYLIEAGGVRLLFDCGLSGGRTTSALAHNAARLQVDLATLDAVVISHLHEDHVGGVQAMLHRTFTLGRDVPVPRGTPPHTPTQMPPPRADVIRPAGPRVIAPGIAVLPPLLQPMFWLGT